MRASLAVAIGLALSLAGCDSCKKEKEPEPTKPAAPATSAPEGDAAAPRPATDKAAAAFCTELYQALDDHARCTAADQKREEYKLLLGVHEVSQRVCADAVGPGAERGRLRFDKAQGDKCIDAARAAKIAKPGSLSLTDLPACAKVVTGLVDLGGACADDIECKPDLHCEGAAEGQGKCAAAAKRNEACQPTTPLPFGGAHATCGAGLACDPDRKCGRVAAVGERCLITDGTSCDRERASCWNGTCRARAQAKGACEFDGDCVPGLYCDRAPASEQGTCAPKKPKGAPCRETSDCLGLCVADEGSDGGRKVCVSFCGSG